jgi:hypothetical protein
VYELVVLVPTLALGIKHFGVLWASLMSRPRAGLYGHPGKHQHYNAMWLETSMGAFYPGLILVLLGSLAYLGQKLKSPME